MKTKSFRRPKNALSPYARLALSIGGGVIVVLIILRVFFPNILYALASPFWYAGSLATEQIGSFEDAQNLFRENQTLKEETLRLQNENLLLKEQLKELGLYEREVSPAGVLARPPLAPYDVLIVSLSAPSYVSALVYGPGGVPIGAIDAISGTEAHVGLYSASGRMTEGWLGEERLPVRVMGEGSGSFSITLPQETPVSLGDEVFLPGPGALMIGTVARINTHQASTEKTLSVRPLVNPFSISFVTIAP